MDMLVCRGLMIEAKVAEALVGAHRVQALNYLLLAGMRHGRLVNFGTDRVQHEFVSTTLTPSERQRFVVRDREWAATNDGARLVRDKTLDLLADWGGFLDVNLYREALVHFLGGADRVNQPVEIFSGARPVAVQRVNLLDAATALAVTASPGASGAMRVNLERLLLHTRLECIQWVNLQRHRVEFTTITRRGAQRPVDFSHDSVLHDSVPGCFL